jgi:inorganic phosphate transporter, PiT family
VLLVFDFTVETSLVFAAVAWLAYANGSNDNFKGVATLFGAGVTDYRTALLWATVTTLAGSMAAVALAGGLAKTFSGQGIVPDAIALTPRFAVAVVLGAAATVMLATRLGFPISTTHALVGALTGTGLMAAGAGVRYATLSQRVLAPLVVSPLIALCLTVVVYLIARAGGFALGVRRQDCVCAGEELAVAAADTGTAVSRITVSVDTPAHCVSRYDGRLLGVGIGRLLDRLHYLSAGAVSFARGLNDAPKIAALLLITGGMGRPVALSTVALAMAAGGLLGARRVAETLAHRVTAMSPGQGFSANLVTAALVTTASLHGLPVSTTHVSVGSLAGVGAVTAQARWRMLASVGAAWIVTLPVAAAAAGLTYVLLVR